MESDPRKTQIFNGSQNIFMIFEARSRSATTSYPHKLGLLINLIKKFLLNKLTLKSFVDSFNIFCQNIIEFVIEFGLSEVFLYLLLTDSIIFHNWLGVELYYFQVVACFSDDVYCYVFTQV